MRRTAIKLCLIAIGFVIAVPCLAQTKPFIEPTGSGSDERPFVALWRQTEGRRRFGASEAPYLRFAVWDDGRVVFAKDPNQWGHDLLQGKISAQRVARLKKALQDSGVFDLQTTTSVVPDAPIDCLMVDLGDQQQMLYWDEREMPGYGINIDPKPQHIEFKRCWKTINNLALLACPDHGETHKERFRRQDSWYLKRAKQSE